MLPLTRSLGDFLFLAQGTFILQFHCYPFSLNYWNLAYKYQ
jgi:hypothetical protein